MGGTHTPGRRIAMSASLSVLLAAAMAMSALIATPPAQAQDEDVVITVVGNRADLISAGDALVQVDLPEGGDVTDLTVTVGDTDVSDAFALRPNALVQGLVDGLEVGDNEVTAELSDGRGATLTITNHPVGGPVISGPQIQPWICRTEDSGLEAATDAQCNAPTVVEHLYMPEGGEDGLQPYDVENPPADVATTTTDQGKEVPFIVRHERGTMNRGVYAIAVLEDPAAPMEPWDPEPHAWNHKVHWPYGASCGVHKGQTTPTGVLDEAKLASGFMIANNSLNILGDNCNTITSAEASMMLQEHIAEQFGEIRYVIGTGCSGGSIGQNMVANNYPGLIDGIIPNCTYMDNYSTGMEVIDCHILLNHFANNPQFWADPASQSAVLDQQGPGACTAWEGTFASIGDPSSTDAITGCDLPADQVYDAESNPEGVRCTTQDYAINLWGERPESEWGAVEQALDRGFANAPYENVGVEYGLKGLQAGDLLPAQFVNVNAELQSVDIDFEFVDQRTEANETTAERIYRSGSYNDFRRMDAIPIIDLRGSSNLADIHTDFHSYGLRQRLMDVHGHHDNAVLWTWQARGAIVVGISPSQSMADAAFRVMDEWLTAIEADETDASKAEKVVANKPDEAIDKCFSSPEYDSQMDATQAECEEAFPHFGAPRTGANMPITHDVFKCALTPLPETLPTDGSYGDPARWVGTSWEDYRAAHPDGVCDFEETPEHRVESVPWLTFADVPGGEPLGPEPVSVPFAGSATEPQLSRFSGLTRIETAVAVSARDRDAATTVVLARADNFPDALAAGVVAVELDAPLLLTYPGALAPPTLEEITRLGATEVVIVGGEVAITPEVEAALTDAGLQTRRLGGGDRTATAAAVTGDVSDVSTIYVANSDTFTDALVGSTLAAVLGEGFLLVEADQVPDATQAALSAGVDLVIVGDEAAVSPEVQASLDEAAGDVTRIAGDSAYATSVLGAQAAVERGATTDVVWIATGRDYPDALVAGAAAAREGGVLLLVDGADVTGSPETVAHLAELAGQVAELRISGGPVAVSAATARTLLEALEPSEAPS